MPTVSKTMQGLCSLCLKHHFHYCRRVLFVQRPEEEVGIAKATGLEDINALPNLTVLNPISSYRFNNRLPTPATKFECQLCLPSTATYLIFR